jgi:hypothetical protein
MVKPDESIWREIQQSKPNGAAVHGLRCEFQHYLLAATLSESTSLPEEERAAWATKAREAEGVLRRYLGTGRLDREDRRPL